MPSRSTLNLSPTPELASFIAAEVGAGHDQSASAIAREALRPLKREGRRSASLEVGKRPHAR